MNKQSIRLLSALGLATLSLPSFAMIAAAIPFKDASGIVYFQDSGQVAAQKLTIELTGTPLTKNVTANQCGLATISAPSSTVPMPSSVKLGSTIIDVSLLSVTATPKCNLNSTTGTYTLATPAPSNFKTIDGKVVVIGQTPSLGQVAEYIGIGKVKNVTADKCGMAKLGSASSPAPSSFKFNGSSFTTSSLSTYAPNRCIGGVKYSPATGGSGS